MFGEDEDLKQLRQEWADLSYDEKVDKFLWKMVWYHHTKHIPGEPPHKAINRLADVMEKASYASENLSKSITLATWVGGLAAVAGVLLTLASLIW